MKILKYILFTIAGLIVLFFTIGLLKPSVSYGHEVEVNKPIKEAWAVSQDESKYSQWLDGFTSIDLISGEKGKLGSKYKVVVNPGEGQDAFEMIETVVSVKEFDHVSMEFDSEFMDFEQTMTFSEANGGSKIKTDSKVIGKGIMSKSMFAVMEILVGGFTKQEARNIDALKKVIEENDTDYYPEHKQEEE
jgi:hypothetical protein